VRLHAIFVELNNHLKNDGALNESAYLKIVQEYQSLEISVQDWLKKNT
jgi:hypothetical protein